MPILEARPHPNADKLLLLQVDVGDQQKQIVARIREHYTPEQLVGKLIGGTVGVKGTGVILLTRVPLSSR